MTRVLYAGTPETAVPPLEALLAAGLDVVGVLTRNDAPVGRKRVMTPSPVARRAEELGLPVIKSGAYDDEAHQAVTDLAPDIAAVVAYGAILPSRALDALEHGWINLHFSVLPAWRGAAPVQRALMAGERELGASVFQIEKGMDTGPVYKTLTETASDDDTAGTMLHQLSISGGALLAEVIGDVSQGRIVATPQSGEPTYAAKLTLQDGRIDWSGSAADVAAQVRGVTPEPGAWTELNGQRVKMQGIRQVHDAADPAPPGTARLEHRTMTVACGVGRVSVERLQPAGKKMMAAADWARGAGQLEQNTVVFQ
ncbi:methionyl-tRNA formyltransferase [Kocuria massiliensis]|uniref:methionyl-tRNA formyltransferase n=1 Tax=Kocuria massiliensis TaxID=1926282 RepID=UPI000A1CBB7C|nr:methionyl-tRNA formyltransferase [Kocuria massiliensis]